MSQDVVIDYTNWKGNRRERHVWPKSIEFTTDVYHPEWQWMLLATDREDDIMKHFPLAKIHSWRPVT